MKEISIKDLKNFQLEILDNVTKFCDKNCIQYWLDFGTLLGAVRHKGYIPWDDDIDIGMLRKDYNKFLSLFNQQNDRYRVYSIENNKDFYYSFAKVLDTSTILYEPNEKGIKLNVNIDVFPYDNAIDINDVKRRVKKTKKCRILYLIKSSWPSKSIWKRILIFCAHILLLPFSKSYFLYKIVKIGKKQNNKETQYIGCFNGINGFLINKEFISKFSMTEFEGKIYKIPWNYDEYLTAIYGDYMKLPPENERKTHHAFKAYKKD